MRRRTGRMRHQVPQCGFSLIELLIVVAIILIIAAIALPNFMRARMAANETATVANLRNISTAQVTYASTYNNGYAPALGNLGGAGLVGCNAAQLIDPLLAAGQRSGYNFTYAGANPVLVAGPTCAGPGWNSYFVNADPITPGSTGQRHFCTDESAVIRQNPAVACTVADSPIN